jgi:hypothetical protein
VVVGTIEVRNQVVGNIKLKDGLTIAGGTRQLGGCFHAERGI